MKRTIPTHSKAQKKQHSEKQGDLSSTLTLATLILMSNTSVTGIFTSLGKLTSGPHSFIGFLETLSEILTVLISAAFLFLNAANNMALISKNSAELILKAKEKIEDKDANQELELKVSHLCQKALQISKAFKFAVYSFAGVFLGLNAYGFYIKTQGNEAKASVISIIGYIIYILSVILIVTNHYTNYKMGKNIEKKFLS